MEPHSNRVVVITGARKGIGKALCEHFLRSGAVVYGLARGESSVEHAQYRHLLCDVRVPSDVTRAFAEIGRSSKVDILVNNAAVLSSHHSMFLSASNAEDMLRTNVLGPFLVAREAAKRMKGSTAGRIINIGSMAAVLEPVGDSMYAATKAALVTLTNVLAREFASLGVTCNTVGVTAVETEMLAQLPRQAVDKIIAQLPLPRYATFEDIFNVVDFFSSPRSSYITAQTIYLGGLHQ